MPGGGWLVAALRHDRWLFLGGLALVELAAMIYIVAGAGVDMGATDMTRMEHHPGRPIVMDKGATWPLYYTALIFAMWWVMMVAMMVPSAAPTILLHRSLTRAPGTLGQDWPTWMFTAGYLVVWAVFSLLATALQWAFQLLDVLSPAVMAIRQGWLAGSVLVLAGLYQFTPLKQACLRQCQSPATFLSRNWRPGALGAWTMGVHHGIYCLGCCWALMALLFIGGVMNLYWIAGLAVIIALEKGLAHGRIVSRAAGAVLLIGGLSIWLAQARLV